MQTEGRRSVRWEILATAFLGLTLMSASHAELKLLDKPLWVFPGQTFRIAIEQPPGSGDLHVDAPPAVEMFDTWPKDSIQRFYFRALKPGDVTLIFKGKAGMLHVPIEILSWSDIYKPRKFKDVGLPRIWPLEETNYGEIKKRRTFYTQRELEALRESKTKSHRIARQWLEMGDEEVWNIIPGPCVPRTCLMVLSGSSREEGRGKGCPVCGTKVYEGRSAFYPWIFDPAKHPWKVGCPSCGNWFPSNDWHKGDMHSGDFPDDGFGCEPVKPVLSPNGAAWRWPFIAYYHEWAAYMNAFTPGIEHCARAFAITGDRQYAHKAAVGLLRFAESMLDMSLNLNHRKMAVRDAILRWPVGAPVVRDKLSGTFLYIQPNWDTPRMEQCARAWDMIFDQVDGDEELLEFCRTHHHPEIQTAEDFQRFVEAGVLRMPVQACLDNAVARNYPMQEVTVGTMALVMDSPRCLDLADWLLNDGAGIRFALTNQFFKDGSAHESEGYNHIQIKDIDRILDLLERIRTLYPEEWKRRGFVPLYDDPKYRLMYDFPLENSLIGRTFTCTGDTGQQSSTAPESPKQGYPVKPQEFINVYARTHDPRFAQAIYSPAEKVPAEVSDPEARAEVEKIGKERGWQVKLNSNILDGYGHAILRSGSGDRQRTFWLRYGRVIQHSHPDMLSIGLAALKRNMLPELGYPQGWTYSGCWESNWGTHYATHITGIRTTDFGRGYVTLFSDTPPARAASAVSELLPGGQKAMRSRTIVLVDLSEEDCYAVTLQRVLGGEEHTMSFHGPDGPAAPVDVHLAEQHGGTVLGPDVRYGDDSTARKVDPELSCLAFMYDVKRGQPEGLWGIDYLLKDQKDVHLRMTMLGPEGCELAIAKGKPPQGKKSYEMTWAILQRKGAAPLASQFLTVLEPYEGERLVSKIEHVPFSGEARGAFEPLAIRVTSRDFVDTILFQGDEPGECRTDDGILCDGEFGFWRERSGKPHAAVIAGGTKLRKGTSGITLASAKYSGRVRSCDWRNRTLIIEPSPENIGALAGQHVRIGNEAGSNASYLIEAAEPVEGGCRIRLPFDSRVGEGFVGECRDGCVVSETTLRLHSWRYYAGKTIANEDASVAYRLSDAEKGVSCILDENVHGKVSGDTLRAGFSDKDGDGRPRFLIYGYGPGDQVTIKNCAAQQDASALP